MPTETTERTALIEAISQSRRALWQQMMHSAAHPLMDTQLTMPQFKVLVALASHPGITGQDLAERMGAAPATLTGILDRLDAMGLVVRAEDATDRRVRRISLTPEGSQLTDKILSAGDVYHRRLLETVADEDLPILARALGIMVEAATRGSL